MRTAARIAPAAQRIAPRPAPIRRAVRADPRWPQIVAALQALRDARRHAVRIVDADCACGTLLIEVARHARAMGFTAIEGRGIDGSPAMIGRARAAAARLHDPAIGLSFDMTDMRGALLQEAEAPADLLLWHGGRDADATGMAAVLAAAATRLIADGDSAA
ncbi:MULTISPECIES: hypothetical protein [unclassified Sphingomonas]|uniref:hypothetical protein n=1 Tax=unclassified Sphingomonas TaxID=196159 RepID=UPI0006F63A2C|nr:MULTISPECIES: hypothetical protein [unclassified Sphingomonas]KQM63558.1 hypothetical protein ASE65_17060 [Sphingomonas sp. Leaf16]KQN15174.1 hypothetical protein ASE81_17075 [Sphingomonas sp. Leaf29]KQN20708.1 hypothetical protein ASE83_17040 [Sphingomonas sp. Leaf32]